MKIREFIHQDIDIDVYDDVCEALEIAFVGPVKLTDAAKNFFEEVLDYDITLYDDHSVVSVDDDRDAVWKHKLRLAHEFFYAAAGYCSEEDYNRWFCE